MSNGSRIKMDLVRGVSKALHKLRLHKITHKLIPYNPDKHWVKAGKTYYNDTVLGNPSIKEIRKQERHVLKILKGLEFSSAIDVACGYGRFSKLLAKLANVKSVVAFDISPHQIVKAEELNYHPKIGYAATSLFDVIGEEAELVLVVDFLLHMPPDKVMEAIEAIVSLSTRYVVVCDAFPVKDRSKYKGCYNHDLAGLFFELGLLVKVYPRLDLDLCAYVLEVKK